MKTQLVIELLKNPDFYDFIRGIKYYEWDSNKQLYEVTFGDYLDLFMANYYKAFKS